MGVAGETFCIAAQLMQEGQLVGVDEGHGWTTPQAGQGKAKGEPQMAVGDRDASDRRIEFKLNRPADPSLKR